MSDINLLIKRYTYITDEATFIDSHDNNRKTSEEKVLGRLLKQKDATTAVRLLESMKANGMLRSQVKKGGRPNFNAMLRQSYENIRPRLTLRKYYFKGNPVLYSVDEQNQVTFYGDAEAATFANVILKDENMHAIFATEYEESDSSKVYMERYTFVEFLEKLYDYFNADRTTILPQEPKAISWDPAVPAFRVLDFSKIQPGPTPNWDGFLSRMDFPETFKAYVWSAFNVANTGRQCMWIQGEGLDGKSSAVNAIASFLGRDHILSISKMSLDSSHFFAAAYGKNIGIYMDCKKTNLLRTEAVKSLLGQDTVEINGKFQNVFAGLVYCKLFVGSNYFPKINYYDNSERTRLLLVRIKSFGDSNGDSQFQHKLETEMPQFLYKCRVAYEMQCPNNNNLIVPPAMDNNIQLLCAAADSEMLMSFITEHLDFNKKYKETAYSMRKYLKEFMAGEGLYNKHEFSTNDLDRFIMSRGVTIGIEGSQKFYLGVKCNYRENLALNKKNGKE